MAIEKKSGKRAKPKFLRNDWHKKIRLGSTVKKNRKWKGAKGRHNKLRLNRKGHQQRPKVGWGSAAGLRDLISGVMATRVENVKDLESVKAGTGIIIGKVGGKKKAEIMKKAEEMKLKVLNRYKKKEAKK
jgi:ribosomal protein L32E